MGHGEGDNRIDLLDRARQGDGTALNQLLEVLRPEIRTYLEGQIQSHPSSSAQAEELAQKVLLRIARSIESCQANSAGELWAWVRTIARRLLIDRYRKRRPEIESREWISDESLLAKAPLKEIFGESATRAAREDTIDLDIVLGRLLHQAQGELSEGTQKVVRRHLLFDETWRETGAAVGTSGPGAKRRWQRAVPRLRREVLARLQGLPEDLRRRLRQQLGVSAAELPGDGTS